MFRKNMSILLILMVFLTASSPLRIDAQSRSNQTSENKATEAGKNTATTDLRKVFGASFNNSTPQLDPKQLEKDNLNAPRRARLSKGQKTGLYIGIAGAIAATVIIIAVTANKKEPDGCVVCLAVGICPPAPPPNC